MVSICPLADTIIVPLFRQISPTARLNARRPLAQGYQIGGPDIFSFREIGMLAADAIGRPDSLTIRTNPISSLRLHGALASILGLVARRSRRSAAILQWMIYSGTHDAVASACGVRRIHDNFISKLQQDGTA
jgi:hypothetical protein